MTAIDHRERVSAICRDVVLDVSTTRSGHLRLQTALQYPDGSSIDVFVRLDPTREGNVRFTDFGQTTAWLLDLRLKPWLSAKRRRFLEDCLVSYGAELREGAIEIESDPSEPFAQPVLRMAQACLRVADLMFTQRSGVETVFKDRVEDFFATKDLPFEPDIELTGRKGRIIRLDYRVKKGPRGALVLTLGTATPSSTHNTANEIFSRWYEIRTTAVREACVTIFDESAPLRDDDFERLRDVSEVIPLTDEDGAAAALAA